MPEYRNTLIAFAMLALAAAPVAAQDVKIGALMSMTGDLQVFGEANVKGIELAVEQVNESVVRKAAPHSWGDDRRVMEWCALFLEAYGNVGEGEIVPPTLEVGTDKGASALMWLELLKLLPSNLPGGGWPVPVVTVDPYGGKPYEGGNGSGEALYGVPEFVAMKQLLAGYGNHYHFPVTAHTFLGMYPAPVIWAHGEPMPLERYQFVLLDGEHKAESIASELDIVLGRRRFGRSLLAPGGIVVVDNIDADPATFALLPEGAEVREAKWGQAYAVFRAQTSAKEQAA